MGQEASCRSICASRTNQVKGAQVQTCTQLTQAQRYQIYALLKTRHKQTEIARLIKVHRSTISREMQRNRGLKGYRPKQAHQFALKRAIIQFHHQLVNAGTEGFSLWILLPNLDKTVIFLLDTQFITPSSSFSAATIRLHKPRHVEQIRSPAD